MRSHQGIMIACAWVSKTYVSYSRITARCFTGSVSCSIA
jgi:hypothetical protein